MSVLSIDGINTWSTKLDRIGELSTHQENTVFNNLGHIIDYDMLKEIYHNLDGTKAVGVDKITKELYSGDLTENLTSLLERIRRGTYKPKPARVTEIPKEDGSKRPLAISCLEDKLVQQAVSMILGSIYEPLFLDSSYGFRPGMGCHDAIKALNQATFRSWNGAIVEIDIKKYFNRIPHQEIMSFLQQKVTDKRFLRLIQILIATPTIEGNVITANKRGCPQGSIISPVLANIYLHHVIDLWFAEISKSHISGRAELVRYADDMVFTFEYLREAERFFKVLPKRLAKFGLEMHQEKSAILPAGHNQAERAYQAKRRLPTFNFLGFTCYWGKSRRGYWTLRFTSRRDRFNSTLKRMKAFLREHLTTSDTPAVIQKVISVIQGWVNYHNISYNRRRVSTFILNSKRLLLRWFNRRGGKKRMNWQRFLRILEYFRFPRKEDFRTISVFSKAH